MGNPTTNQTTTKQLRSIQLSYKRVSDWAKRLRLSELQRDSLQELLRECEVQTVAPKYPINHGEYIRQYHDEVFVWFDEAGLVGGVAGSLEAAEQAWVLYVNELERGKQEGAQPPFPVKLTYKRLGMHVTEVDVLPRSLVYDELADKWTVRCLGMADGSTVDIALEHLCGEGRPYHGMDNHQAEAMYVMLDEMSGLLKAASRQLRHGPRSTNPDKDGSPENREMLSIEFGRLWAAYASLGSDNGRSVKEFRKRRTNGPGYLHHPKRD